MSYSIKKGHENDNVSAKIFDGTRTFKGLLKDATQGELEEMHLIGIPLIIKSKTAKRKTKKRDNSPNAAPVAVPPENE